MDPQEQLKALQATHEFCICIDSDGCVFDSMEIKHKECFCPAFINHFDLQPIAKYARETWEFVNLYSKTRGCNRFIGVTHTLALLAERADVKKRQVTLPAMQSLLTLIQQETKLGNPALIATLAQTPNADLQRVLDWSMDLNNAIEKIVRNVPPFPGVRACLDKSIAQADVLVVSQTPCEALEREWEEHDITKYARLIAGQEMGTKTEHITYATKGKYAPEKVLMIGDAPGDYQAALANNALCFPINPGLEEASWSELLSTGLDHFFNGTFAGEYQQQLITSFEKLLPQAPPWK